MNSLLFAVSLAGLLAMQAGGFDLAVAEKWEKAKVVAYRAEGVHNGREAIVHGDYEGKADVIDRITVEFTWDCKTRKIVGPVTVTDGKTELKNIKSDGTNCPPPQLKGAYEHFQTVSHSLISGDQIQIKGTRTYPPASVSNYPGSCSMRSIPGGKAEASLFVAGADPGASACRSCRVAPSSSRPTGRASRSRVPRNWVWTFTPTLVQ